MGGLQKSGIGSLGALNGTSSTSDKFPNTGLVGSLTKLDPFESGGIGGGKKGPLPLGGAFDTFPGLVETKPSKKFQLPDILELTGGVQSPFQSEIALSSTANTGSNTGPNSASNAAGNTPIVPTPSFTTPDVARTARTGNQAVGFAALAGNSPLSGRVKAPTKSGDDIADQVARIRTLRTGQASAQRASQNPAVPPAVSPAVPPAARRKAPGAGKPMPATPHPVPVVQPSTLPVQTPRAIAPPVPASRPAFTRDQWRHINGEADALLRRSDFSDYMDFGRDALSRDYATAKSELEAVRDVMARTSPDQAQAFNADIQQAFRDLDPNHPNTAPARAQARLDARGDLDPVDDTRLAAYPQANGQDGTAPNAPNPTDVQLAASGEIGEDLMNTFGDPTEGQHLYGPNDSQLPDKAIAPDTGLPEPGRDVLDPKVTEPEPHDDGTSLVDTLDQTLDGKTPLDQKAKEALIKQIEETHKHDPGARIALTEIIQGAHDPNAHAALRDMLSAEKETIQDPTIQAKVKEIEGFVDRIEDAYPGGIDRYVTDRAKARFADIVEKTRLVDLARQWVAVKESGSNDLTSQKKLGMLEKRIKQSITQSLENSAKARAFISPPHGDQDWVLARRFSQAEEALVNQRTLKEGAGSALFGLATMPLSGPTAFGATTLAGATAAAHDSKRSDTEKLLKSAEVKFKDPIAVKDFIHNHKAEFQRADAKAMHTLIANLVGTGAGKFVSWQLGDVIDPFLKPAVEHAASSATEQLLK